MKPQPERNVSGERHLKTIAANLMGKVTTPAPSRIRPLPISLTSVTQMTNPYLPEQLPSTCTHAGERSFHGGRLGERIGAGAGERAASGQETERSVARVRSARLVNRATRRGQTIFGTSFFFAHGNPWAAERWARPGASSAVLRRRSCSRFSRNLEAWLGRRCVGCSRTFSISFDLRCSLMLGPKCCGSSRRSFSRSICKAHARMVR